MTYEAQMREDLSRKLKDDITDLLIRHEDLGLAGGLTKDAIYTDFLVTLVTTSGQIVSMIPDKKAKNKIIKQLTILLQKEADNDPRTRTGLL